MLQPGDRIPAVWIWQSLDSADKRRSTISISYHNGHPSKAFPRRASLLSIEFLMQGSDQQRDKRYDSLWAKQLTGNFAMIRV